MIVTGVYMVQIKAQSTLSVRKMSSQVDSERKNMGYQRKFVNLSHPQSMEEVHLPIRIFE